MTLNFSSALVDPRSTYDKEHIFARDEDRRGKTERVEKRHDCTRDLSFGRWERRFEDLDRRVPQADVETQGVILDVLL
ncbi:hypothetical protein EVAR_3780_1 [Eumeta japonica]|uniref:Uncharacterized protein n=1 Tax=Eumeta variegata TaxID=151549 RepID=A0A4C1SUJ4_EUMVA|nr:hypothetical protein EVAR_3780_1 [Eumeta japonica]